MKADCSRDSFDPRLHFLRVIQQQGRPVLDAEINEQTAILLHYLRSLAADLIGPSGGPEANLGFQIQPAPAKPAKSKKPRPQGMFVSAGRFYVNGILCENDEPFPLFSDGEQMEAGAYFVYLDVWEQFISPLDHRYIPDPALEGVVTTARSKVAWRVHKVFGTAAEFTEPEKYLAARHPASRGRLHVRPAAPQNDKESEKEDAIQYTGENQLYRVEIQNRDSFKWARDNASNIYPLVKTAGGNHVLADSGRDDRTSLADQSVVEIVHPDSDASHRLHVISNINPDTGSFTLTPAVADANIPHGAYLRRWDHRPGKDHKAESLVKGKWIELENGLSIKFEDDEEDKDAENFQPGDYWLIPAREVTQAALWSHQDARHGRRSDGVHHYYAPLAVLTCAASGTCTVQPLQRSFKPV